MICLRFVAKVVAWVSILVILGSLVGIGIYMMLIVPNYSILERYNSLGNSFPVCCGPSMSLEKSLNLNRRS